MKSGIILFEDGEVQQFGSIVSIAKMVATAQETFESLAQQQRKQLLESVTEVEMKQIIDRVATKKQNDEVEQRVK